MISDLKRLSEALDEAAPGVKLAATVREQRDRIQKEIREKGVAFVTVDGRRFKVLPTPENGAAATSK